MGSDVPLYQWGRKDPMFPSRLASSSPITVRNARIYDKDGNWKYSGEEFPNPRKGNIPSGTNGVAYAIQHPEEMLMGPNGIAKANPFQSWAGTYVYFNLWNSNVTQPSRRSSVPSENDDKNFDRKDVVVRKTVYDPCPPGFCVPNEYAFTIFNSRGFYRGDQTTYINAVGGNAAGKQANFEANLGYTFYTTADGEGHTHGRVFMRAVGRRNGNNTGNPSLTETPTNTSPQSNTFGSYWTAGPYLYIGGTKRWVYGRCLRFGRTSVHGVYGLGGDGDAGFLASHALPVRPVWDKDSDRNNTNHGHLY